MGTYVDVLFGHAGEVEPLAGFEDCSLPDGPRILQALDVRLYVFPRVALLHHPGVAWWSFTQGESRDLVRARTRDVARLFGAERMLYLADGLGVVADGGEDDLDAIEAFLRGRRGPPSSWDAPPPAKDAFRASWFLEAMTPSG